MHRILWYMKLIITIFSGFLFAIPNSYGQTLNTNPYKVKFETSDIVRFWSAFDSCQIHPQRSKEFYDQLYFGQGTVGLKAFKTVSIKSTENLIQATEKHKLYYESIRVNTMKVAELKLVMHAYLVKFKQLYPVSKFPNVYFLIGDLNSGGKSEKDGLLISCEVNCADSNSNFTNVYPPFIKTLKSLTLKNIYLIVVHELVHYQQSYVDSNTNLLGYAIKEGSADFICKVITGKIINNISFEYGENHEKELWNEFKKDMKGADISKWLYNRATEERPSDLGYYIGYKITESYYLHSKNKKAAINEILNIKDFDLFLGKSIYETKFNK
jgi:hypothetical protein